MNGSDKALAFFMVPYLGVVIVAGLIALVCALCGCSSPSYSEPRYPEYDKWWSHSVNTNSFEGLGQGDVYVHEFVTTNLVLGADGLRREIVTNRTEAVLL